MTIASRQILGIALLAMALALPAAQQNSQGIEQDIKKTEQQKKAVAESLARVQKEVARDADKLSKLERELHTAEKAATSARSTLRVLRQQRAEAAATRQKLLDQRKATEADLRRHQGQLADQLRSAYYMGRNEPLQLLLNQGSSTQISRMLTYYGYFGRLRAEQIDQLKEDVARIEGLTVDIEAEDARLAALEERQKAQVGELEGALVQRGKAMASLEKEARSRKDQQAQLVKERQALEKRLDDLIKRLARATESTPYDPHAPFAKVRGKLAWPVSGRISVDYGQTTVGSLRSNHIEIEAPRGTEVRAIHEGRVEWAGYTDSLGMLVILNHGNGFISLYAHNDELFRQAADQVKAGDLIATVGDTGGRKTPGLHFEIRSGFRPDGEGRSVNPHEWFRTDKPPAR